MYVATERDDCDRFVISILLFFAMEFSLRDLGFLHLCPVWSDLFKTRKVNKNMQSYPIVASH